MGQPIWSSLFRSGQPADKLWVAVQHGRLVRSAVLPIVSALAMASWPLPFKFFHHIFDHKVIGITKINIVHKYE
jgi:hypothetical protein